MKLRPENTELLMRRLSVAVLLGCIGFLVWQACGVYLLERVHVE